MKAIVISTVVFAATLLGVRYTVIQAYERQVRARGMSFHD
jgi:hypothetical protein